ncbi:4012_t:CDS:2, partial [Funneliformis geosporum]
NYNPKNLTNISVSNNNLKEQNIEAFSKFVNLEELCIGNDVGERLESKIYNRFSGSLESLKKLINLKKLQIEGTKVEENFEHLPKDLRVEEVNELRNTNQENFSQTLNRIVNNYAKKQSGLSLTSRQQKQIEKIIERIGNAIAINVKKELEEEINGVKWTIERDKKQNDMIAKVIPLERLYVIRGNIKQFINNLAAGGIVLSFYNQGAAGSGILGIYPIVELVVSNMEKSREDSKNNYNELLGIVKQFKVDESKTGEVNETLNDLNDKIKEFLSVYDKNDNEEIDINELVDERDKLVEDLIKGNNPLSLPENNTSNLILDKNNQEGYSEKKRNSAGKL